MGEGVEAGSFVRLTFTFANAEAATLNVPVVPNTDEFEDVELSGSAEVTTDADHRERVS